MFSRLVSRIDPRTRRWLLRALVVLFYLAVAWTLVLIGRRMDWAEVGDALRALPGRALLLAALCSAACYLLYACYELLAAGHCKVGLRKRQVAAIGFVSYTFNLNLGAILGALGVRLRLYAARGIPAGEALRMVAFNLLTNWSGYVFVLGATLLCLWSEVPAQWRVPEIVVRSVGALLLVAYAGYLLACARARRRTIELRGQIIELPSLRTGLLQLALAAPAWLLTAASLCFLLPAEAAYDRVVVTLLFSAVAGLVIRVPAGLGLVEAVFLASLGAVAGAPQLMAGLLAYRCIHYLGPLLAGVVVFLMLELLARIRQQPDGVSTGTAGNGAGDASSSPPRRAEAPPLRTA